MPRFVLSAIGPDGYGIVARVTRALAGLNCNLADSTMSNLSGHFAILLVIDAGEGIDERTIFNAVQSRCSELSLMVDVKRVETVEQDDLDGERFVVSVYGTDRPGIVAGICEILAAHGANIYDLTTRVIEVEQSSVYTMVLEVGISDPDKVALLEKALHSGSEELGVSCSLRSVDADEL